MMKVPKKLLTAREAAVPVTNRSFDRCYPRIS